jgi:diketogulonate reductase-like aldo/keto reductase
LQHGFPKWLSRSQVGEALQQVFKEGLVKREELFITSKLW